MTNPAFYPATEFDPETELTRAVAQRDELLARFPKLVPLQEDIDQRLAQARNLTEKFAFMGAAHASFQNNKRP